MNTPILIPGKLYITNCNLQPYFFNVNRWKTLKKNSVIMFLEFKGAGTYIFIHNDEMCSLSFVKNFNPMDRLLKLIS